TRAADGPRARAVRIPRHRRHLRHPPPAARDRRPKEGQGGAIPPPIDEAEVQVRPAAEPGAPEFGDLLARSDALSRLHEELRIVRVRGNPAVRVDDNCEVSIPVYLVIRVRDDP